MADKASLLKSLEELEKTISERADEELRRTDEWEKKQVAEANKVQREIQAMDRVMSKWGDAVDQIQEQLKVSPILKESGLADLTAAIPTGKPSDKAMSLLNQLEDTRTMPSTLTIPKNSLFAQSKGRLQTSIDQTDGGHDGTTVNVTPHRFKDFDWQRLLIVGLIAVLVSLVLMPLGRVTYGKIERIFCSTPEAAKSLGKQPVKIEHHAETLSMTNREVPHEGIFLQEVIPPPGADDETNINDLCWTPEGALLVARCTGKQLVKIALHPETLSMTNREVLYEGEEFSSVSCGRDASWGAVVIDDHIKLHQPGSSSCQEWRPAEVPRPFYLRHYKDEMWVKPNPAGPVRVYGRDLKLRRTINVDDNKNLLQAITVSDGRLIATTSCSGHYLHILSLSDESLITVGGEGKEDGKFKWPIGVSTDTTGHILVCDYRNKRVSVFTPSGLFLHHLDLEWGDMDGPFSIAVRERVGKPPLLAIGLYQIRIYEIY